ncbi:MAG: DUF2334 domain-containing protein [Solirubrobacteraceae bacterium]
MSAIAVAVHGVEPATFTRCALIRDWLDDHGIAHATLLVVPAPHLHPIGTERTELLAWLGERAERGDAIAQHGLGRNHPGGEFARLDADEARRAVDAGRRVLRLAGLPARGFVAPAYAYTPALHEVLRTRFEWWAGLARLWRNCGAETRALAVRPGAPNVLRRFAQPWAARGALLRVDIHPADLDHPRRIGALEHVLGHANARTSVTYDQLA